MKKPENRQRKGEKRGITGNSREILIHCSYEEKKRHCHWT